MKKHLGSLWGTLQVYPWKCFQRHRLGGCTPLPRLRSTWNTVWGGITGTSFLSKHPSLHRLLPHQGPEAKEGSWLQTAIAKTKSKDQPLLLQTHLWLVLFFTMIESWKHTNYLEWIWNGASFRKKSYCSNDNLKKTSVTSLVWPLIKWKKKKIESMPLNWKCHTEFV